MEVAMKVKSGGGITSNKYKTSKAGQKVEPRAHRANIPAVADQGLAVQYRKAPLQQGPGSGYEPAKMGSTGIAGARQGHAGAGPGGGNRTIYKSGSQSPTPPAHGMSPGRDTLAEFGPDLPGRRGNR
jgi:hypothetical protein